MKPTRIRLISLLLAAVMCVSILPVEVFAWGKMTHIYTANLMEEETGDQTVTVTYHCESEAEAQEYSYSIPKEFYEAIYWHSDMFLAGALGPDLYPDIITGQMYIHPADENIDAGEWITVLCDAVNRMGKDTRDRDDALAFTLGCILHYCGDLFGHDFVNTFSGGSFPSLMSPDILDIEGERLNNVLSHLSVEKYMDGLIYPTYSGHGSIEAPINFVSNVMVFNGTPAAGLAAPYARYPAFEITSDEIDSDFLNDLLDGLFSSESNNVPPHYTAILALRNYVTTVADEYRENMEPVSAAITRYYDEWAEDIDEGIYAFTVACDNIARRMITREKNPDIEKKKQEAVDDEKNYFIKRWQGPEARFFWDKISDEDSAKLKAAGIYGDSFFDLVLLELVADGVISMEMLTDKESSSLTIIKEELNYWMDEYGVYMIGIPDIIIDGIEIPVIGDIIDLVFLGPLWDLIGYELKKVAADFIVSACTGTVTDYTGMTGREAGREISAILSLIDDRMEDPRLQLDHAHNPYKPSENNFAELEEFLNVLPGEAKNLTQDSELEALYNTLTMFKLVLMGPDNYTQFVETHTGVRQTAYQKNTAEVEATALRLEFKTSDLYLSGTDDNIYAIVYQINANGTRTQLTSKLLDKSGINDFEHGETNVYTVELPRSVKLSELEVGLRKGPAFDFLPSLTDDWFCENLRVTPLYAGYEVTGPIDLGGIQLKGICKGLGMNLQEALKAGRDPDNQKSQTVTNLNVRIQVKDELYAGSDSDIYLVVYNGDKRWKSVCLDKALYNDLERNDNDTYIIPITIARSNKEGIPLDQLTIRFEHDGIDEANWQDVVITPCYGSLELTSQVSVGGKKFEDWTWKTDFQSKLKNASYKQYDPFVIAYETNLDDGLLRYMDSLDGGEEWVDSKNELWANTALRRGIFFEIFKGFAPEIEYTGEPTVLQCDSVEIVLDLTGVWNGVSNDRRSQVKDFEYVYPVDGGVDIALYNEQGEEVYSPPRVTVANGTASHSIVAGKLAPGYYDLAVSYYSNDADPRYANTTVTFEKALQILPVEEFVITKQPENVTAASGKKATFTVEATGGKPPYTYQWQISEGDGDWSDATGSWSSGFDSATFSFTVSNDEFDTGYEYRCIITDAAGNTVTSNTVVVIEPLEVVTQPKDVKVITGEQVSFTVKVTGGKTPYEYTWQRLDGKDWKDIRNNSKFSGQGKDTLSVQTTDGVSETVRCIVKDSAGKTVTSEPATATVQSPVDPMAVRSHPWDAHVQLGQTATFTVEVTGGRAPYSYYWQIPSGGSWSIIQNSSVYSGQGTDTLRYTAIVNGPAKIRCVVIDSDGNDVTSNPANITVTAAEPLVITGQPQDKMADKGAAISLQVQAGGGAEPLYYQWQGSNDQSNWVNLREGNGLEGVNASQLTILSDQTDFYLYARCVVTDALGTSVTSDAANVVIIKRLRATIYNEQPYLDLDQGKGESFTLTADVTGGLGPYTYTWYLQKQYSDQWEVVSTDPFYEVDCYHPHIGAKIYVVVTDSRGKMATSNEVWVRVSGVVN